MPLEITQKNTKQKANQFLKALLHATQTTIPTVHAATHDAEGVMIIANSTINIPNGLDNIANIIATDSDNPQNQNTIKLLRLFLQNLEKDPQRYLSLIVSTVDQDNSLIRITPVIEARALWQTCHLNPYQPGVLSIPIALSLSETELAELNSNNKPITFPVTILNQLQEQPRLINELINAKTIDETPLTQSKLNLQDTKTLYGLFQTIRKIGYFR